MVFTPSIMDPLCHDDDGTNPAALNFNDDFCGGTVAEGNLLFNAVLDTGEHGTVNGWGRQPLLYLDPETQRVALAGRPRLVRSNFVVRTSYRGQVSSE